MNSVSVKRSVSAMKAAARHRLAGAPAAGFHSRLATAGMQAGMTLMEIIIVVALLGTLMTYLVTSLTNTSEQARVDQAKIAMGNISQALNMYRTHNGGKLPTSEQGLDALIRSPGDSKKWRGPYIEETKLNDPWDVRFGYSQEGRDFKITSAGIDGVEGTEDDIVYPEPAAGSEAAPAAP